MDKKVNPPKICELIIGFLLGKEEKSHRLGDLHEVFSEIHKQKGRFSAIYWYCRQIFVAVPKISCFSIFWRFIMFKNYFKIAMRNIIRQKSYSFINITGLALGMACCIFLLLWVHHQASFDKFHKNANHLYRVEVDIPQPQGKLHGPNSPYPLGPAIKESIPEIKNLARWQSTPRLLIRYGEKQFYERARAVDPPFLRMFSFPFINGNPATALSQLHSIVLSEEAAKKYFENDNPLGKIISINNKYSFKVTGVMKNFPSNSTLTAQILVPFDFLKELGYYHENWLSCNCHTWVELNANSQESAVGKKITDLYLNRILDQQANFTNEEIKSNTGPNAWEFLLMPLTDINLYGFNVFRKGKIQGVRIFLMLAFVILLIACINYINLATARSARRAKEIGLRKVVGANKNDIIVQFFGESMFLTFISIIISLILVNLFLPVFNELMEQEFTIRSLFTSDFILNILFICLLTGVISGSYPALFLSNFRPIKVLKASLNTSAKGAFFRKSLVVFQFTLSVILIITTIVAYRQIQFMMNKKVGYNKEHLIYIPLRNETMDSYAALKEELLKDSRIVNVSGIDNHPTNIVTDWNDANWEGKDPNIAPAIVKSYVDFDFIETMKIEMKEGRAFSKSFPSDASNAFLVNEEMLKLMDTKSAVGKNFSFLKRTGTIIGVMKNFHHRSVASTIEPLVLVIGPNIYNVVVRLQKGNVASAIEGVKSVWQKINPQFPFEYTFFDEDFATMYRADEQMQSIFKYSSGLAIIIACIGLYGLVSFMAERRTKEIGIRKVLGASISRITVMLSKEFLGLILIANVIAWPIAYLIMNNWLKGYAFRASINWWIFLLAGLVTVTVSLLIVSYQSIKAALANPIEAIIYE